MRRTTPPSSRGSTAMNGISAEAGFALITLTLGARLWRPALGTRPEAWRLRPAARVAPRRQRTRPAPTGADRRYTGASRGVHVPSPQLVFLGSTARPCDRVCALAECPPPVAGAHPGRSRAGTAGLRGGRVESRVRAARHAGRLGGRGIGVTGPGPDGGGARDGLSAQAQPTRRLG